MIFDVSTITFGKGGSPSKYCSSTKLSGELDPGLFHADPHMAEKLEFPTFSIVRW